MQVINDFAVESQEYFLKNKDNNFPVITGNNIVFIEDNISIRTVFFDSFNVEFPHVHGYGHYLLSLFFCHGRKKVPNRIRFPIFTYPENYAGFEVNDYSEV